MIHSRALQPFVLLLLLISGRAGAAPDRELASLDRPFTFAYGSWQGLARLEGGRIIVRGVSNQGGAGVAVPLDLAAHAALSPALEVRVGPGNQAAGLQLLLQSGDHRAGTWRFRLPAAGASALLLPLNGAPLARPNEAEGALDLAHITTWQIVGDWAGAKPVDLEVTRILLLDPATSAELAGLRAADGLRIAGEARAHAAAIADARAAVTHTPTSPRIERVYTVAPDVLAIAIRAQAVVPGRIEPYRPLPGDILRGDGRGGEPLTLVRGGREVARVLGRRRDALSYPEAITGDPLREVLLDAPGTWSIASADDPAYALPTAPIRVSRKSKATDWAQGVNAFPMRHIAYLHLPRPLRPGSTYAIDCRRINLRTQTAAFAYRPAAVWSEAVHVNQVGFRPDDPVKRAFLSVWLGTGGAQRYPAGIRFSVIDAKTGAEALRGRAVLAFAAEQPEDMWVREKRNWNRTDVLRMDFAGLRRPGRYRVVVDGVGASYPFRIDRDVWLRAFLVQMRGFLNQRSGVALGPPYTPYRRPRDMHPADGDTALQSDYSVLDGGDEMKGLVARATTRPAPEAWGGYHDAGDWNPRRVTHMRGNTDLLLELLMLRPQDFGALRWPLPDPGPLPAMLKEVLFEVDCFRRLQTPAGGVRYGIETDGDPSPGDVSWKQTKQLYVYAPDAWSSFIYAGIAARAAVVAGRWDAGRAAVYRASALRAMEWAEREWPRVREQPAAKARWEIADDRNFAALELYRLTEDRRWLGVFLEDTVLREEKPELFRWGVHVQSMAAHAYATLPTRLTDPAMRARAVRAVAAQADRALAYAQGNAFNLTTADRGRPLFQFFYTVPGAVELIHAHQLTGDRRYLAGAIQACLFPAGANPGNLAFTTGVGADSPRNPLKLDARATGQTTPDGQTIYGPCDFINWTDDFHTWPIRWWMSKICTPSGYEWPIPESYFDIFLFPAQTEYTVEGFGQNAYVWGYLWARP